MLGTCMSHTHLDGTSRIGRLGASKAHLRVSFEHDFVGLWSLGVE